MTYVPKYIKQNINYKKNECVSASDYNNILNLLITASDYNTEILNNIANNNNYKLVINSLHSDLADVATVAHDSEKLSGAPLSRAVTETLQNNDNYVPSSKQVKDYVDALSASNNNTFSTISDMLSAIEQKNTTQDNRLASIDLLNTQHGTRISTLESHVDTLGTNITTIHNKDIGQDATLSQHDQRLLNLELSNVPDDVVKTLMTKGGYALQVGVDAQSLPVYSTDTVAKADTALNVLINSTKVSASDLALSSTLNTLANSSFVARGVLANPTSTIYSVGELKALKHGSYDVSTENSTALNTGGIAGTLRLYPCTNGISLEYELQAGINTGKILTMFIAQSTANNVLIDTLTWYNENNRMISIETRTTALENTRLKVSDITAGADISLTNTGNNVVVNYTGPKIVISATQPSADPNRQTLWLDIAS